MPWKERLKPPLAAAGWYFLCLFGDRKPEAPRIAVIMYHSVGSNNKSSFDPVMFDEHLASLREHFSQSALIHHIALLKEPVKQWVVCLTFDDGFSDNYDIVLPLLQKYSLRGTFFVCTGFVNGECDITQAFRHYKGLRPMCWTQIKELSAEGMEIGSHTHTHPLLSSLSPELQYEEMHHSKNVIEDRLGKSIHSLAIPFGSRGSYTRETLDLASKQFDVCCTTRFSTNPSLARRHSGMVLLNRVEPKPTDSLVTFQNKINGRWDAMKWLQRGKHVT